MRLALTDPLTGLGNHRYFHEQRERSLVRAEASGIHVALCLVDIDDFKEANDAYGHPAGDELLEGPQEHEAMRIAEGVHERVSRVDAGPEVELSVSAGIAVYPGIGVERSELVRVADSALYLARGTARDGDGAPDRLGGERIPSARASCSSPMPTTP